MVNIYSTSFKKMRIALWLECYDGVIEIKETKTPVWYAFISYIPILFIQSCMTLSILQVCMYVHMFV